MEILNEGYKKTIRITKSKNVHAWSNNYVGQKMIAHKIEWEGKFIYVVVCSENKDIKFNPSWVTLTVNVEDAI